MNHLILKIIEQMLSNMTDEESSLQQDHNLTINGRWAGTAEDAEFEVIEI
jgi:hypothetical protein